MRHEPIVLCNCTHCPHRLNKCDTVSESQAQLLSEALTALNPTAKLIRTTNSCVEDLHQILNTGEWCLDKISGDVLAVLVCICLIAVCVWSCTALPKGSVALTQHDAPISVQPAGLFDMERAQQSAGWLAALKKGQAVTPQHGINSWVYRARR